MMFTKTLIFAFIGTALAFPEGVLVSNGLTRAPKVITRDIPRSELAKRDFDPTIISTEDHPTNPLMVRQTCNPCSPDGCGACGSTGTSVPMEVLLQGKVYGRGTLPVTLDFQIPQLGDLSRFGAEEASLKLSPNFPIAHSGNLPICISTTSDTL
ncbi:hypothetical protein COCVIDRAFT_17947 [Bipolaris victoriae FI3]|uniref:Uncharacterized protein n=1 Tax=Bipolaris victoriae (strain FI3) TaxID=930091 RepID=W7EGD6_BIPV3|nr:hypothetical protein COCVIDRAFT_17947 [Bipolaris victoriae FI3]